jgi:hypothetical protein
VSCKTLASAFLFYLQLIEIFCIVFLEFEQSTIKRQMNAMSKGEALEIAGGGFGQIWCEKHQKRQMNAEKCFKVMLGCWIFFAVTCIFSFAMWIMNVRVDLGLMFSFPLTLAHLVFIGRNMEIFLSTHWLFLVRDWIPVRRRIKVFYKQNEPKFQLRMFAFLALMGEVRNIVIQGEKSEQNL